jgi:hypothetical protein
LRDVTERPEAVEAGAVRLVGTRADEILAAAGELLDHPEVHARMAQVANPTVTVAPRRGSSPSFAASPGSRSHRKSRRFFVRSKGREVSPGIEVVTAWATGAAGLALGVLRPAWLLPILIVASPLRVGLTAGAEISTLLLVGAAVGRFPAIARQAAHRSEIVVALLLFPLWMLASVYWAASRGLRCASRPSGLRSRSPRCWRSPIRDEIRNRS